MFKLRKTAKQMAALAGSVCETIKLLAQSRLRPPRNRDLFANHDNIVLFHSERVFLRKLRCKEGADKRNIFFWESSSRM